MVTHELILVVEDDAQVRRLCAQALTEQGYQVVPARNGSGALQRAREEPPHLAIIDVIMPGMNGFELCQSMRATPGLSGLPILFLTAKGNIVDKAAGFAVGGDDYLTKPFDVRELVMRVRALLRRASPAWPASEPQELIVDGLRLDRGRFTLTTPEKTVLLTSMELALMACLMSHPGQPHASERLLQEAFGYPPGVGSTDLVRRHIRNIREKIEPAPSAPRYLRTVQRHGYAVGE